MNMIAYRKGLGDVLAEGTVRAAEKLGYKEFLPHVTCGFADHATGRGLSGHIEYPYWIVAALLWATDSRDPYSDSGHAYGCLTHKRGLHYLLPLEPGQIRTIARNLWGSEEAVMEGYSHKARPAIWLQNRGCITSSLPTDDWVFPIIGSNFSRDGLGDTSFESRIYSAVTGADHPEKELDKIGERIFNLERAIAVREGRDRKVDERVIPYFMKPDWTRKITLDEKKFRMLMSENYSMRGWDVHNGRPTKAKLRELGLSDVADQLYS
jgi:aldehyde:ferredoxin oxidoreductase